MGALKRTTYSIHVSLIMKILFLLALIFLVQCIQMKPFIVETEVPQIPDYCTEEIPEMNQNCTSDRDCFEGLTCIKDQGCPFCFDNDIYFQTGCPCERHDDCPEACYPPQSKLKGIVPGCGPWLQ